MKKKIVTMLLCGAVAFALTACGSSGSSTDTSKTSSTTTETSVAQEETSSTSESDAGVTKANYKKVKKGMTYDEVKALFGEDGEEQSSSSAAGQEGTTYTWESDDFGAVSVVFVNDKVASKAQAGVDTSDSAVTLKQYKKVKTGMTYKKVVKIFGSEGTENASSSAAGSTGKVYTWSGEATGSTVSITFVDNKVQSKAQVGLE